MNLRLVRFDLAPGHTLGALQIDGAFFCYTLEDASRIDAGFRKIYGKSAIPCGTYKVRLSFSNRFQYRTPEVLEVPGFTGIRVHPGNRAIDTEGCILPGFRPTSGFVSDSRSAFAMLMGVLPDVVHSLEILQAWRESEATRNVWAEEDKVV
jgi:hypothetical protein